MFKNLCYPKMKKIEKMMSNLRSLENKLRAEMSKNAVVCITQGVESRSNARGIYREIAGSEAGEENSISYKSTSRSNKVSFVRNGEGVTSLAGLPLTVLLVG